MSTLPGVVWITWEDHRRTRGLCDYFQLELRVLSTRASGLRRYLELIPRTFRTLRTERPHVLIVQSPSLVLALVCLLWRGFMGYKLVVDAHNEGVEPFINPSAPIRWLTNLVLRHADLTIVTNRALADIVVARGGRAVVLPDRVTDPPQLPAPTGAAEPGFNIAVIATFARDEPIENILAAAAQLPADVRFVITGNSSRLPARVRESAPANVSFAGFLSEERYWELLRSAQLVIDLSLIDNCLVCGGYESLSVGTPLLLSNSRAAREHFRTAARFTDNSTASIVAEVTQARLEINSLRANARSVCAQLQQEWPQSALQAGSAIRALDRQADPTAGSKL